MLLRWTIILLLLGIASGTVAHFFDPSFKPDLADEPVWRLLAALGATLSLGAASVSYAVNDFITWLRPEPGRAPIQGLYALLKASAVGAAAMTLARLPAYFYAWEKGQPWRLAERTDSRFPRVVWENPRFNEINLIIGAMALAALSLIAFATHPVIVALAFLSGAGPLFFRPVLLDLVLIGARRYGIFPKSKDEVEPISRDSQRHAPHGSAVPPKAPVRGSKSKGNDEDWTGRLS